MDHIGSMDGVAACSVSPGGVPISDRRLSFRRLLQGIEKIRSKSEKEKLVSTYRDVKGRKLE